MWLVTTAYPSLFSWQQLSAYKTSRFRSNIIVRSLKLIPIFISSSPAFLSSGYPVITCPETEDIISIPTISLSGIERPLGTDTGVICSGHTVRISYTAFIYYGTLYSFDSCNDIVRCARYYFASEGFTKRDTSQTDRAQSINLRDIS